MHKKLACYATHKKVKNLQGIKNYDHLKTSHFILALVHITIKSKH